MVTQAAGSPNYDRSMGIWMTTAIVIGAMIGSGIFMLPMSLSRLGPNAIVGWVLSCLGALSIAFALARLSCLGGDGIQANIEHQLGSFAGFLVAWCFWVSNWAAAAAVAIAGASALSWMGPTFGSSTLVVPIAVASVALFTAVNAFGARTSGFASIVTVLIRVLPLAAVILILALRAAGPTRLQPLAGLPLSFGSVATATSLTFFALTGFENATTPVGKVRDPSRTIPRAIVGGTLFVAVMYVLSSTGIQLLVPVQVLGGSPAPFADAVAAQWGGGAATIVAAAVAVAAFGCLNALIMSMGELGYGLALRNDLPRAMARTWRGTPVASQIVGSALSIILIVANSTRSGSSLFTFVILLSTSAVLVVYLAGTLSAWAMVSSLPARTLLTAALLFIAFAFYGAGFQADAWCIALLGIGIAVRALLHAAADRKPAEALLIAPLK